METSFRIDTQQTLYFVMFTFRLISCCRTNTNVTVAYKGGLSSIICTFS